MLTKEKVAGFAVLPAAAAALIWSAWTVWFVIAFYGLTIGMLLLENREASCSHHPLVTTMRRS